MLCNDCNKNEANVHLTHIINGKKSETHLCEECAKKNEAILNSNFSMQSLFSAMMNNAFNQTTYLPSKSCSKCKMTFEEFRNIGKFGCSECIETFRSKLLPVVKNIQGYDSHVGKIPQRAGGSLKIQRDIEKVKNDLKIAIEQEKYEEAAQLRDKIRQMESNL